MPSERESSAPAPAERTVASRYFDPPTERSTIRVTTVYGTSWAPMESLDGAAPMGEYLRLGRLEDMYRDGADQLPAAVRREEIDPGTLDLKRWSAPVEAAWVWLFTLPSGQVVAALSIDFRGAPIDAVDVLEDCYYNDVKVADVSVEEHLSRIAVDAGVPGARRLAQERHQLVYLTSLGDEDQRRDLVQRLVYRADLPCRDGDSSIRYPVELNRRPYATAATGPFVSVFAGQQDYIENAAFISAVQCVGSAVRLRETRDLAYEDVRVFRAAQADETRVPIRRHTLERIANQLGNLELEMSFAVESARDLGMLVPSLRVISYHETLFDGMGLSDKAAVVGRMLGRLDQAVRAEMTAITSAERRADENRRLRWTAAVGFLSTVALPISLVFGFLGINAAEVAETRSMFSTAYIPFYLGLGLMIVLGLVLSVGLYLQQRARARRDEAEAAAATAEVRSIALVRRRSVRLRR